MVWDNRTQKYAGWLSERASARRYVEKGNEFSKEDEKRYEVHKFELVRVE
jgi:hypothetical protein